MHQSLSAKYLINRFNVNVEHPSSSSPDYVKTPLMVRLGYHERMSNVTNQTVIRSP